MTTQCRLFAAALGTALALAVGGAGADDTGPPVEVEVPQATQPNAEQIQQVPDQAQPFTGIAARQDWQSRRTWGYGSQNLYPLTRGMQEAGIPRWARWPLYPFTAAFDTGNVVFSAIGGLYGD